MKIKVFVLFILLLGVSISFAFASLCKKPELRWTQLYRYDLRHGNHEFYVNRISATFNYLDKQEKPLLKLIPFFEIRRNVDKNLWERKEAGIEIGKDIFPWLYLGEAIQKGWIKEDYRYDTNYETRDYLESESRLLLSRNLLSNKHINLKGFILNEYTYDFDTGRGTRNEVFIGLVMPVTKFIETEINWRHIDRIHYYDCDTFESSVSVVF